MESAHLANGLRPVLSTEEVADLLRLNPRTVLAMARDGRLPGHRLSGCRKVQYLTAEILAAVAMAPGIEEAATPEGVDIPSARTAPPEVDPCDVWGAAPSWQPGEDWRQRCRSHWVELASQAGLPAIIVGDSTSIRAAADDRSAGRVEVDGLMYEVLVGPRQRTRYIDDEGEVRWCLIDAVWVEPIHLGAFKHADVDSQDRSGSPDGLRSPKERTAAPSLALYDPVGGKVAISDRHQRADQQRAQSPRRR